jgi:hypothetical protein
MVYLLTAHGVFRVMAFDPPPILFVRPQDSGQKFQIIGQRGCNIAYDGNLQNARILVKTSDYNADYAKIGLYDTNNEKWNVRYDYEISMLMHYELSDTKNNHKTLQEIYDSIQLPFQRETYEYFRDADNKNRSGKNEINIPGDWKYTQKTFLENNSNTQWSFATPAAVSRNENTTNRWVHRHFTNKKFTVNGGVKTYCWKYTTKGVRKGLFTLNSEPVELKIDFEKFISEIQNKITSYDIEVNWNLSEDNKHQTTMYSENKPFTLTFIDDIKSFPITDNVSISWNTDSKIAYSYDTFITRNSEEKEALVYMKWVPYIYDHTKDDFYLDTQWETLPSYLSFLFKGNTDTNLLGIFNRVSKLEYLVSSNASRNKGEIKELMAFLFSYIPEAHSPFSGKRIQDRSVGGRQPNDALQELVTHLKTLSWDLVVQRQTMWVSMYFDFCKHVRNSKSQSITLGRPTNDTPLVVPRFAEATFHLPDASSAWNTDKRYTIDSWDKCTVHVFGLVAKARNSKPQTLYDRNGDKSSSNWSWERTEVVKFFVSFLCI